MKKNRKNSAILRTMRGPRFNFAGEGPAQRIVAGVAALVAVVALAAGCIWVYSMLNEEMAGQCVLSDVSRQIVVETGKNVPSGVILEKLSLTNGANLAKIDFAAKREKLLADIPNLRSVTIERRLPDKVQIFAEERIPVARIDAKDAKRPSGRVVDVEGVVFRRMPGTKLLPFIRERKGVATPGGGRLEGRLNAALRLVVMCSEQEFAELRLVEVDTTPRDWLLATLGSSHTVKFKWEGMDEATPVSQAVLRKTLTNLRSALRTHLGGGAMTFDATMPDRIFADTKDPIQ